MKLYVWYNKKQDQIFESTYSKEDAAYVLFIGLYSSNKVNRCICLGEL